MVQFLNRQSDHFFINLLSNIQLQDDTGTTNTGTKVNGKVFRESLKYVYGTLYSQYDVSMGLEEWGNQ